MRNSGPLPREAAEGPRTGRPHLKRMLQRIHQRCQLIPGGGALNCGEPSGTCFSTSMGTGPKASARAARPLAGRIAQIGMGTRQKHPILNRDCVQLARAHAVARRIGGLLDDLEAVTVLPAPSPPHPQPGRVQDLLPGLRADGIAKNRLILAAPQPIGAAILLVALADRKVSSGAHLAIDDRALVHGGAKYLIPLAGD
jgi:hypothetical protein